MQLVSQLQDRFDAARSEVEQLYKTRVDEEELDAASKMVGGG